MLFKRHQLFFCCCFLYFTVFKILSVMRHIVILMENNSFAVRKAFVYSGLHCLSECLKLINVSKLFDKHLILHFIWVYTVCKGKKDLQTKAYNIF